MHQSTLNMCIIRMTTNMISSIAYRCPALTPMMIVMLILMSMMKLSRQPNERLVRVTAYSLSVHLPQNTPTTHIYFTRTSHSPYVHHHHHHHQQQQQQWRKHQTIDHPPQLSRNLIRLFATPRSRNASAGSGKSKTGGGKRTTNTSSNNNSSNKKKTKDRPSTQTPRANNMRYQSGTNDGKMGDLVPSTMTAKPKAATSSSSSSKSMPPWSVRSAKDAIQNVESEKIRRATIQQQQQQQIQAGGTVTPITSPTSANDSRSNSPLFLSKAFLSNKEQQFIKWKRFKTSDKVAGQRLLHTFFNQTSLQQQILPNYGVPEIAFIGRSNVGKSSLLNTLSSSTTTSSSASSTATTMARVGKTPGATASVNMYSLYDQKQKDLLVFTDLPGFGYAKLSKDRQEAIIRTTEQYIYQRSTITKTLALGILLLDIRRTPSQDDIELLETLYDMNVPILVVVTKCDKVSSKYEREQLLNNIQKELQLPQSPFTISSMTGENINLLWQIIFDACDTCIQQMKQIYEAIDIPEEEEYYDDEDDGDDIAANESHNSWYDDHDKSTAATNNLLDDDDDIEYDQGFDWVDDNIMLEYDDGYSSNSNNLIADDYHGNDDDEDNDDSFGTSSDESQISPTKRVTLKSLKRRVKKMQRRGQI